MSGNRRNDELCALSGSYWTGLAPEGGTHMKRTFLLTVILTAAILLLLCGCEKQTEDPNPSPVDSPEVTEPVDETVRYIVRLDSTVYRSEPNNDTAGVLGVLNKNTRVDSLEQEDGVFVKVRLEDGQEVWINGWYLRLEDEEQQQLREAADLREKMASATFRPIAEETGEDGAQAGVVYTCMANLLNCRAEPSTSATVLYQISFGTEVTVLGMDQDFYLCRLKDGGIVYCYEDYLTNEATYVELDGAVDLRVFMPTADFELLFASSNNITGEAMYPAIPLMEESTAQMLARAQEIFRADGYSIKIYDAYRPKSAQYKLYDIVQDSRFIADPYKGQSWHQLGRAVDMSLINMATGQELEMPTPMHTFDVAASRYNSATWTDTAKANVDYMTEVMTSVGFGTITTEWWHFENTAPGNYLDNNIDYDTLTYKPVSEYTGETH